MKTFEIEWSDDDIGIETVEVNFISYEALKKFIEINLEDYKDTNLKVLSVREVVCKFEPIDWESI